MTGVSVLAWLVIFFTIIAMPLVALAMLYVIFIWHTARSGWRRLAERFPADAEPVGDILLRQTIRAGVVRYRNVVTTGIGPEGLYLSVRLPAHRPMLIPWSEFHGQRPTRIYWRESVEVVIGDPRIARIAFPQALYALFSSHLNP